MTEPYYQAALNAAKDDAWEAVIDYTEAIANDFPEADQLEILAVVIADYLNQQKNLKNQEALILIDRFIEILFKADPQQKRFQEIIRHLKSTSAYRAFNRSETGSPEKALEAITSFINARINYIKKKEEMQTVMAQGWTADSDKIRPIAKQINVLEQQFLQSALQFDLAQEGKYRELEQRISTKQQVLLDFKNQGMMTTHTHYQTVVESIEQLTQRKNVLQKGSLRVTGKEQPLSIKQLLTWEVSSLYNAMILRNTLNGHSGTVWSVAFSPDGRTLASGSSDKTIKLWEVGTSSAN